MILENQSQFSIITKTTNSENLGFIARYAVTICNDRVQSAGTTTEALVLLCAPRVAPGYKSSDLKSFPVRLHL